jgi:hypothetical protein
MPGPCDLGQLAVAVLREFGFPIIVSAYLLGRVAPALRRVNEAVSDLAVKVAALRP